MTPREKIDAIKKAEREYIKKVEDLKRNYWQKVKKLAEKKDTDRLQKIRKELGIHQ